MATIVLVDDFNVLVTANEEVTFELMGTTTGPVPVVIPYQVFGSEDNQFTLENPGIPSAERPVLADPPNGTYEVDWSTDDEETPTTQKQHQGTIRVGSSRPG